MSSRIREVALIALAVAACNPKDGPAQPPSSANAQDAAADASTFSITIGGDAGGEEAGAAATDAGAALPWQESVRLARWKDAEAAIGGIL